MSHDIPHPDFGRLTFDAEGMEGGRFHSRHFHVPSSGSGLTIGRGYDMRMRKQPDIREDLLAAGVATDRAEVISRAAELEGDAAKSFIKDNGLESFEITPEEQVALFKREYARQESEARRLSTKADVTRVYGATDWDALDPTIKQLLVDLKFRGDYTPTTRKFLQKHVAKNDFAAFTREICDPARWPKVPSDRFKRRKAFCEAAAGQEV